MRNFLCLDLGRVRIGAAVGNQSARLANPLESITHRSRNEDIARIQKIISTLDVTDVIIGISYQEDGSLNSMGRHATTFGNYLEKQTGIPVTYWDETLSTKEARQYSLDAGLPKMKRRGHLDSLAATIILQSFFDSNISEEHIS